MRQHLDVFSLLILGSLAVVMLALTSGGKNIMILQIGEKK